MFFNGIAYFFEQIYSQLNTTEADYCPYGLFSQPLYFVPIIRIATALRGCRCNLSGGRRVL